MHKFLLTALAVGLASAGLSSGASAAQTFEGTATGKHGDITVAVTFDQNKIADIRIVKEEENPVLTQKVYKDLREAIIAGNSVAVDSISGATLSSDALKAAVKAAADKAGVTLAATPLIVTKRDVKIPEKDGYDVIVIGAGGAGFAAAVSAHDAGAKVVSKRCRRSAATPSSRARNTRPPTTGCSKSSASRTASSSTIRTR